MQIKRFNHNESNKFTSSLVAFNLSPKYQREISKNEPRPSFFDFLFVPEVPTNINQNSDGPHYA